MCHRIPRPCATQRHSIGSKFCIVVQRAQTTNLQELRQGAKQHCYFIIFFPIKIEFNYLLCVQLGQQRILILVLPDYPAAHRVGAFCFRADRVDGHALSF